MTIQPISMLPLDESGIQVADGNRRLVPAPSVSRCLWGVVAAVGLSCLGFGDMAAATPLAEGEHKRKDEPLSVVMWSPPPDEVERIMNEAQWGEPGVPFVFSGDALHVGASFESRREVGIGSQGLINTYGDSVLHLSGTVRSEPGSRQSLAKLGAGTLMLSGPNTYAGNTLLLQGGLHVASDSALGSALGTLHINTGTILSYAPGVTVMNGLQLQAVDIGTRVPAGSYTTVTPLEYGDSVQWVVNSGEAVQLGTMAGSAPLVKQGAGRLRLAGDVLAYFGTATVNKGTLAVNRHFSGSVQVGHGARLQGVGVVGPTTINAGGVLAPGNSIGTLTVQGDLVLKPGARFEVEATASGAVDFVQVTGRALLDGDLVALAEAGDWQASTRYTVLRAEQGLDGSRFAAASSNFAFLTPSLAYDDKQVFLTLERNDTAFEEVAQTPVEDDVARALDAEGGPGASALYDQVVVLDRPDARQAFELLSGSWAASVHSSLIDDSRFVRQAVFEYVRPLWTASGVLSGSSAWDGPAPGAASGFWSHAFHSSADRAGYRGTPADHRDIQGVVLGVWQPVGRNWSAGGFVGAQQSRLWRDAAMADSQIHGAHAGLALAARAGGWRYTLGAAHTWHRIQSRRTVAVGGLNDRLQSAYRAGTAQVFGEVSRPFALNGSGVRSASTVIEPFARLAWVSVRTQGFTEQGGVAALAAQPARQAALFSTLGLKVAQQIETATGTAQVQGLLAWRHASGDVGSASRQRFRDSATHAIFESEGQPIARSAWLFELGVQARLAKGVNAGIAYAGQFARGMQDHGARLSLTWAF
ncbi:MAG: autotransporter domain-containing protein [Candidimonas sp.]|nr:MAG: autotransporter domain-containing protein [Candidimonas sp.]TAM25874.1 MAG: autotransporter domain-containing protein [Candidimonas sp.]